MRSPDGGLQGQGHPSPGSTGDHLGGVALLRSVSQQRRGPAWSYGVESQLSSLECLSGNPLRISKIKQGSSRRLLLRAVRMALRAVHPWTCLAGADCVQPLQPAGHCCVSSQPSRWRTRPRRLGETLGTKGFASGDESGCERFPPRGSSPCGKPRCLPECPVHTGQARRLAGPFPRP